jgi:hypothetical protein
MVFSLSNMLRLLMVGEKKSPERQVPLGALRLQKLLTPRLPECGVEASPEMDDPAQ